MIEENIYLVFEAWTSPMENIPSMAFGYKPVGYVTDKYTLDTDTLAPVCWATPAGAKKFKLVKLEEYKGEGIYE